MATSSHTRHEETLLHAVSIVLLALAIARWIPVALAVVLAGLTSGAAEISAIRRRRELDRRRRSADVLIAELPNARIPDALLWRARELSDPGHRQELARQLHLFAWMARQQVLITAVPVSLSTLRPNRHGLHSLAELVERTEQPVTARGIVMLEKLLDAGDCSPLYRPARGDELGTALARVSRAMDLGDNGAVNHARASSPCRSRVASRSWSAADRS